MDDQVTENDLVLAAVEAALATPSDLSTDIASDAVTTAELADIFNCTKDRVRRVLSSLKREGLIESTMKYSQFDLVPWGQRRVAYRFIGGQDALEKLVERLK